MEALFGAIAGTLNAAAGAVGTTSAVGSGLAAVGSAIGGLGGSGSLLSTILQGGATIAGALATARAGEERAAELNQQANDRLVETQMQEQNSADNRRSIKATLMQALGERDVAAAASGVDLSFGTPAIARREAARDADRALSQEVAASDTRVKRLLDQSASFAGMAKQARSSARLGAFTQIASFAAKAKERG